MNKKQYNNVIEHTLKYELSEQTEDNLAVARAVFDNMGIALPQGDIKHVYEVIKTDDYMGWKSCTMQEAQEAANNGTAAIGISENRIVVLAADDEEIPVAETTTVMTLSEKTSAYAVDGLSYAIYSLPSGNNPALYGYAGAYREVNDLTVNCFEYALLYNEDMGFKPIGFRLYYPSMQSEIYAEEIMEYIEDNCNTTVRKIDAYNSTVYIDEYRIAARLPFKNGYNYHFIYQLGDGTWAGKDDTEASEHFGKGNPSETPEMWADDKYSPEAGTIYFAVKKRV